MLYEKVFRRIFRKWACDHDPVEYDKKVTRTKGDRDYYFGYNPTVYVHTTRRYECSFCGYLSSKTTIETETLKLDHRPGIFWR